MYISCFGPVSNYWPVQPDFAGTASIFSGTKQGGQVYQIAGRYGIFRSYRPIRYGIDNLAINRDGAIESKGCVRKRRVPT